MVTKRFCDVCGKEIVERFTNAIPAIMPPPFGDVVSAKLTLRGEYGGTRTFDYCEEHAKSNFKKVIWT
jgi:hypothetical protein